MNTKWSTALIKNEVEWNYMKLNEIITIMISKTPYLKLIRFVKFGKKKEYFASAQVNNKCCGMTWQGLILKFNNLPQEYLIFALLTQSTIFTLNVLCAHNFSLKYKYWSEY